MSASLTTVILFLSFAAALAILAYLIDTYAQWALENDVGSIAASVADFLASQIRDVVSSGAVPGVREVSKKLLIPTSFYSLDAASVVVVVGNDGGNLYVNATVTGLRGKGAATASRVAWIYSITSWAAHNGRGLYLVGQYVSLSQCDTAVCFNITTPGCRAQIIDASLRVVAR